MISNRENVVYGDFMSRTFSLHLIIILLLCDMFVCLDDHWADGGRSKPIPNLCDDVIAPMKLNDLSGFFYLSIE